MYLSYCTPYSVQAHHFGPYRECKAITASGIQAIKGGFPLVSHLIQSVHVHVESLLKNIYCLVLCYYQSPGVGESHSQILNGSTGVILTADCWGRKAEGRRLMPHQIHPRSPGNLYIRCVARGYLIWPSQIRLYDICTFTKPQVVTSESQASLPVYRVASPAHRSRPPPSQPSDRHRRRIIVTQGGFLAG